MSCFLTVLLSLLYATDMMTMKISTQSILPSMTLRTNLPLSTRIVLLFLLCGSLGLSSSFAGKLEDFVGEVLSCLFGKHTDYNKNIRPIVLLYANLTRTTLLITAIDLVFISLQELATNFSTSTLRIGMLYDTCALDVLNGTRLLVHVTTLHRY